LAQADSAQILALLTSLDPAPKRPRAE